MKKILESILMKNNEYIVDGNLSKNKLMELANKYDQKLLNILLQNKEIKSHFFVEIQPGVFVFKLETFIQFINNKEFLPDSFTIYKNHIGLVTKDNKFISERNDVILNFPYKDCILEGGQTKEEQNRQEMYFNEVLAPTEINRLLDYKVLTNFKRYTDEGVTNIECIDDTDNLIIKGNNLIALQCLRERFLGKVKLIYIDPPYNTGADSFNYNDRFNHSTWLVFMKKRLEIARDLLSDDGSIWITLDDVEVHYLKILCDEIFSRDCFVTEVEWQHSDNSNNNALRFSEDVNHILVYSKKPNWKPNFLNDLSKRKHFSNPDNDPKGPWFDGNPVNNPGLRVNLQFDITTPKGNIIKHPANGWRWSKETMDEKFKTGELRFSPDFTRVIRRTYLCDMKGLPPSNLWINFEITGHTRKAKYEQKKLFPDKPVTSLFATPKPELLINHIIDLGTESGDIVLDFFMGSGTTAAVAHKKGVQYIGIEQMDYIEEFVVPRLRMVIDGENGGISNLVNWHGGGSFVYCALKDDAQCIVNKIKVAESTDELLLLFKRIRSSSFLSYRVDPKKLHEADFVKLSLAEQKQLLIELIDQNNLYVNYSDIDDVYYNISDKDKRLNRMFYGEE